MTVLPIVQVAGLEKSYGERPALQGLDLALGPGRILALVGPNGAGKTTAMRAIAGIVRPNAGRVTICGVDVAVDPINARRRMAWVPHDAALFDALTVWEHLRFTASAWEVTSWEARGRDLLARFDLADRADSPAHALSRGMRQKVALACAALHAPDLLMLDEPMTGLDPRAIRALKAWVREEAERGAAVVISSHLLSVVEDLCTDLLILVEGRRRFLGTVEEARRAFSQERLEELFFLATEGTGT